MLSFKRFIRETFTLLILINSLNFKSNAYPIFARQYFSTPREVSGRIACSYCHLAQKPIELSIPQSVFPNTVFEATVKVPYDKTKKQLSGQGKQVGLNIGAILILPEGFSLAPVNRISDSLKEKTKGLSFLPYNNNNPSTFMVGPVSGDKYEKLVFPLLSPQTSASSKFLKAAVYVGGNRGRGQIYPNGEKSNNNVFTTSVTGTINEIKPGEKGGFDVSILTNENKTIIENVGAGATLIVEEGQQVSADQPLTSDPNVGGFGQSETEITIQNARRVQLLIAFAVFLFIAQVSLVLKKKQFEKVQLFEMDF